MADRLNKHIVLASGGTGGHVFPARALAAELQGRGYKVTLMTDARGEVYEKLFPGVEIVQIRAGSPSVGGLIGKVKAAVNLLFGIVQSVLYLRKVKPVAVVGFGGYPSMPPATAASLLGIPLVLHEQNAILGRVNKLLAGRATMIATSFIHIDTEDVSVAKKMRFTGNPVRQEIMALFGQEYKCAGDKDEFNLLVIGGSQGATILSDVVPAAVQGLPEEIQKRLKITQQCRKEDLAQVDALYKTTEVDVTLATFFENMPNLLGSCHLAIVRSGASTMAELAVAGCPAILVPYKYAMDNHQFKNAKTAVDRGAATLMVQDNFNAKSLGETLVLLITHPEKLKTMAKASAHCAEIGAAGKLADLVITTAGRQHNKSSENGKVAA